MAKIIAMSALLKYMNIYFNEAPRFSVGKHIPKYSKCIHLHIFSGCGSSAIIYGKEIIDVMEDLDTSYQSGDAESQYFALENGDIVIRNFGDVASIILFSHHQPKVYLYDIDDDNANDDLLEYRIPKI